MPPNHPCGDYISVTKNSRSNILEIIRFKSYNQKIYFVPESENNRNKVIKHYVIVRVVVDLDCGNTFFDSSLTEAEPTQNRQILETVAE